jgi:hypothetical protein
MEWKIIRENENICNAYYEHERKLKESRKTAIKGYTVCLIMCIPILISFMPGIITMLSSDDFHTDLLVLIIPCVLCILAIPMLVASVAVIKRIERREAKLNLY